MPELVKLLAGELPPRETLRLAAEAARRGLVVAFPTDTVYGLGTSALSREGVERIFRIKGRGPDKPLPLLAASVDEARRWVEWTPQAEALARRFWPGGLTMVLEASAAGRGLPCCQGGTLALRVPDHPVALALLEAAGQPWAQTSANDSGEPPLPDGAAVARRFGQDLSWVIDCGPTSGRESTVVDARQDPARVLREGLIPASDILGPAVPVRRVLFVCTGNTCRSVMAEFLLQRMSQDLGWGLEARSAGVAAERYFQVPQGVRSALGAEGITNVEHIAQLVTRELLDWADLVLVMERAHQEMVLDRFPEFRAKVHTLRAFSARPGPEDVADPIGQSDGVYAACCREIKELLAAAMGRCRKEPANVPHP